MYQTKKSERKMTSQIFHKMLRLKKKKEKEKKRKREKKKKRKKEKRKRKKKKKKSVNSKNLKNEITCPKRGQTPGDDLFQKVHINNKSTK